MRLTVYGACAAAGVITAMMLSGRAAKRGGLNPEATWDAGLFAILSCFAASRILLVLRDPVAFAHFPWLVLSLPSLTIAGMAVATAMTWAYLRRKRMPILRLLDVFAPCGAVLAAFLELGHWIDGSELGMPVFRGAAAVAFRPVSLYGFALSFGIASLLWTRGSREPKPGRVAALGLMLGGLAAFGLDTLSLPADFFDRLWLEPGQIVALAAMLAGALMWTFRPHGEPAGVRQEFPDAATPRATPRSTPRATPGSTPGSTPGLTPGSQRRDLEHPPHGADDALAAGQGRTR